MPPNGGRSTAKSISLVNAATGSANIRTLPPASFCLPQADITNGSLTEMQMISETPLVFNASDCSK